MHNKYVLLLSTLLSCTLTFTTQAADETGIATVNDKPITQQAYDDYIKAFPVPIGMNMAPNREMVINELVNRELVIQDAVKKGLDKDASFLKQVEALRYQTLFNFGMQKYLEEHPVTEERLQQEYTKFKALKQYKLRHILLNSKEEALAILQQLQQGMNFAQLAMQRSIDPLSRPQGGDLGWLAPVQMLPPIAQASEKLTKGQLSPEPIQSKVGWHVVLIEDTREVPPLPFEQAKMQLLPAVQKQLMDEYQANLKKDGKVEIKQ